MLEEAPVIIRPTRIVPGELWKPISFEGPMNSSPMEAAKVEGIMRLRLLQD